MTIRLQGGKRSGEEMEIASPGQIVIVPVSDVFSLCWHVDHLAEDAALVYVADDATKRWGLGIA